LAKVVAALLRGLIRGRCHGPVLSRVSAARAEVALEPALDGIVPGSCGLLLGSADHRIRRAIASYHSVSGWEVAKVAFGPDGIAMIDAEARAMEFLGGQIDGVPKLLGRHRAEGFALLRMPYVTGSPVPARDWEAALDLLEAWKTELPPRRVAEFAEWPSIEGALSSSRVGPDVAVKLAENRLRPVRCHGDFARWNLLRQADGTITVLDWEWGRPEGLPGIDLVHYFAQDARLVRRLPPSEAIEVLLADLSRTRCRQYLEKAGWTGTLIEPIIACLAYKEGSGEQGSRDVLDAALARWTPA
jgi:hypothetical protein